MEFFVFNNPRIIRIYLYFSDFYCFYLHAQIYPKNNLKKKGKSFFIINLPAIFDNQLTQTKTDMEKVNLLNEIIESLSNDLKKGVTLFALKASLSNKGVSSELAEKLIRLSILK